MRLVTRDELGLAEAVPGADRVDIGALKGIAVHHSGVAGDRLRATADPGGYARALQDFFVGVRGYSDIAYNWIVVADGRVLEGRALELRSAANGTLASNREYLSVLFPGDLRTDTLTAAQVAAFRELRAAVVRRAPRAVAVEAHRTFRPTECPGDNVVARLADLRRDTPVTAPLPRPQLRRGYQGLAVRCLQETLNEWGGVRLLVDGDFGPVTEIGVRRFQQAFGLVVDGWVGGQTWAALERFGGCEVAANA
jgi:hypothetical protein